MGFPPVLGLGLGLTTAHLKKIILLLNVTQGFGLGHILWINDVGQGKLTS
jgi:hypothetical protein